MTFLVYETKFIIGKSKEMVFTAGNRRDSWGKTRHFWGKSPKKRYIDKTLPRYDHGSPSNDNTKLDLNSEHS